jgi:hypothetical protein
MSCAAPCRRSQPTITAPPCPLRPSAPPPPKKVLHVGDRFTDSGNDAATRDVCSIVWVANPEETAFFIRMLLADLRARRMQRYIE